MIRFAFLLACVSLFAYTPLHAESKNPADYPLRVHIFPPSETVFYHGRMAEESKGEGRANLFANSESRGVDYTFDCYGEKLKASFGYETYPAKWKKPGQELVVLLPVFGKTNTFFTCNLKTDVKDYTYVGHSNGRLGSEPPAEFKSWMTKHDYDPEHGKNMPINLTPQPIAPGADARPAPAQ